MTRFRSLGISLLTISVSGAVAWVVAEIAELHPDWVGPAVLVGVPVPRLLLGLLGGRWLLGRRRAEFAARLQHWQVIIWACVVAAIRPSLSAFGNGNLEVLGAVVAAAGLCVVLYAVLRALPENGIRSVGPSSAA
jgi:pimeloyl-ACP methyl ester carboxylesterase